MTLDDLPLRSELRRFDLDCHLPALRKLEKKNPAAVIAHTTPSGPPSQWRADNMFFEEPGYYDTLIAKQPLPAWAAKYDFTAGKEDHTATFGGKIHQTAWSSVFTTTSSKKQKIRITIFFSHIRRPQNRRQDRPEISAQGTTCLKVRR